MLEHTATHVFDAPIDAVWAMFTDPAAHVAKFEGMGHRNVTVTESERSDDSFTIQISRDVDLEPPGFAKKVLQPTQTIVSTDVWRANDDGTYSGDWKADAKGAPVDTTGTTRLTPKGDQTEYRLSFSLKVNVPLIGGKIEKWAKGDALKQVDAEFAAGDAWLAEHA